jgi:hypothetical protein
VTNDVRDLSLSADRPVHVSYNQMPWGQGALEHIMTREEAFDIVKRAEGRTPADWLSWMHLGSALHIAGDSEGGLEAARKAMEMNPSAMTLMNVAVILECFGRFDEALELSTNAVIMDPTDQFAGLLHAQGCLRKGYWAESWTPFEHYCWGRIWEESLAHYIPQWYGEPLNGKKLLVIQGGGFGDNMMFMRWFQDLKEMGAHITYACPDVMTPLLEGHPWIDALVPTHEGPETDELPEVDIFTVKDGEKQFDYFVPIMGIPRRLNVTIESLRWDGPYISAIPDREIFRKDYPDCRWPRIGICWMGAEKLDPRRHRSLDKLQIMRLLETARLPIHWVNLQFGTDNPSENYSMLRPKIRNWKDTARIIAGLDLVATVDTGVMHLAGAMGKPTWAMIPSLSDWKFLLDREDSPFYPSLRLFRNGSNRIGLDHAVDLLIQELHRAFK